MKQKIKELQELATEMVGDGKSPNLFFVSVEGVIITVTRNLRRAYKEWVSLPRNIETCLEDRQNGVLADTSPEADEPNARLRTYSYEARELIKRQKQSG